MKKFKKIFLAIVTLALGLTLASCKDAETRNTTTPYGSLSQKLNTEFVKTENGKTLTYGEFYNRLRTKSYDLFTKELKYRLYEAEITAITNLLNNTLTDADKKVLSYTGDAKDADLEYLKTKYSRLVQNSLATSAYGTYSLSTYNNKTEKDINLAVAKYIQTLKNRGYEIPQGFESIFNEPIKNETLGTVGVDYTKYTGTLTELVKEQVLTQAQYLHAEKELYNIPEFELDENGNSTNIKNKKYLFTNDALESTYESTLMNYGTYQAIIIQFNSYKDAKDAIAEVTTSIENPEQFYLDLYNAQYSYRADVTSTNDTAFTYEVNEEINDLSKISSGVYTLITETLEDGDYLVEPRNVNNKYVMAYRLNTLYEINNGTETNKSVEFDKLTDAQKAEVTPELKKSIVESKGSSQSSAYFTELVEENDIKIYDPFFEYKFEYSYATQYDTIEASENNDILFSVGEYQYTVDKFYELAKNTYGQSVIYESLSLKYAEDFVGEYVTEESQEKNAEALEAAVKAFKNNENTTYPAEIGLETFLLASYGYTTEENVLAYYYDAATALTSLKAEIINEKWVNAETNEVTTEAMNIIEKLLVSGNKYTELFSINIDHILINFDDNGDGNPDNPADFLANNPTIDKAHYEASIAKLAQAIYTEATYLVEKGNTNFEAFKYIIKQYNKGAKLESDSTLDWDDYKEYNFLLTAEQLSSSSDITQDSVSNFVVPFANYVKDVYAGLSDKDVKVDEENGSIVIANAEGAKIVEEASEITYDSLCETSYGYHLLVVNEYNGPEGLKTSTNSKYNTHKVTIYTDDDKNVVFAKVVTENPLESQATKEQLFVYFVQKTLSASSTLDHDIETVLGDLYDEAISTYTSGNFQTLLLIDTLNIKSVDDSAKAMVEKFAANERINYVNLVTKYDSTSIYAAWCSDTTVFRAIK